MVDLTHDPARGGRPRLILSVGGEHLTDTGDDPPSVEFPLDADVTSLGGDGQDIALDGLVGHLGSIAHDEHDEFVLVGNEAPLWVNGAPVLRKVLRTGDRLDLGHHTLSFFREEYADHGRPFGGRQGGELSVQQPQPPRSMVSGAVEPTADALREVRAGGPSKAGRPTRPPY
jgi:hypothetical protein